MRDWGISLHQGPCECTYARVTHAFEPRKDPDLGSCQNYGPFWGTVNNRCRIIKGTQKGTIILTTTHLQTPPCRSRYHVQRQ